MKNDYMENAFFTRNNEHEEMKEIKHVIVGSEEKPNRLAVI